MAYETKVIVPGTTPGAEAPEVGPRLPFRHVPLHHTEPAGVAAESNSLLPGADLPESGAADRLGRRRRKGPDTQ